MRVKKYFFFLWFSIFSFSVNSQTVTVAPIFQSYMVLQQNELIKVWGTGSSGESVNITLGEVSKVTSVASSGEWSVNFNALSASFIPITLQVNDIVYTDILVGEVWICAGQSNMQWRLEGIDGGVDAYANSKATAEVINNSDSTYDYTQSSIRMYQNKYSLPLVDNDGYSQEQLDKYCNTDGYFEADWSLNTETNAKDFSGVGWRFAERIFTNQNVPVGIIQIAVGGSVIDNFISPATLNNNSLTADLLTTDWLTNENVFRAHQNACEDAFQNVLPTGDYIVGQTEYRYFREPGFLFEVGVEKLKGLQFKGLVWYQGESDATSDADVARYKELFPMLINDWRSYLDIGDFHVAYVQLPRYFRDTWADFREDQRLAEDEITNAYMAVTIDLGLVDNIHPTDKLPVANRLSNLALYHIYNQPIDLPFFEVEAITKVNETIELTLNTSARAFTGNISGFEKADSEGVYSETTAVFNEDYSKITVDCTGDCLAIRYGWEGFPNPDLEIFNQQNLPLGPFKEVFETPIEIPFYLWYENNSNTQNITLNSFTKGEFTTDVTNVDTAGENTNTIVSKFVKNGQTSPFVFFDLTNPITSFSGLQVQLKAYIDRTTASLTATNKRIRILFRNPNVSSGIIYKQLNFQSGQEWDTFEFDFDGEEVPTEILQAGGYTQVYIGLASGDASGDTTTYYLDDIQGKVDQRSFLSPATPVLDEGNIWLYNYTTNEFNATETATFFGVHTKNTTTPTTNGNSNTKVSKFIKQDGDFSTIEFDISSYPVTDMSKAVFKLRVYREESQAVTNDNLNLILRQDSVESTQTTVTENSTISDKWVEYIFDFTDKNFPDGVTSYNSLLLVFASPDTDDDAIGNTYYFDALQGYDTSTLSINNNFSLDKVKLFPIPVLNTFKIDKTIKTVTIYDVKGKMMKKFEARLEYDISDLSTGIYTVKIIDKNNKLSVNRLIKR